MSFARSNINVVRPDGLWNTNAMIEVSEECDVKLKHQLENCTYSE